MTIRETFRYLLVLMLIFPYGVQARQASTLDVGVINNFLFGTWAVGSGSLTDLSDHCVASSNYTDAFTDPPPVKTPPAERLAYSYKVIDKSTPAGYYMYLGSDTTNTGNATIKVNFTHADILDASGDEILQDDTYDSHGHIGGFRLCKDGDNSRLTVNINSTDLEQAQAGLYRGFFTAQAIGGSTGTDTDSNDFRVDVTIANIVRVSALDDIFIGAFALGGANLVREETFCLYSNNAGAGYSILISGANQDVSGNFFVANAGATAFIPYQLQFKSDTTAGGGTAVSTTALTGVGTNTSSICSGVDNAKLTLTVLATDMTAALPDSFTDTLTLTVSPL